MRPRGSVLQEIVEAGDIACGGVDLVAGGRHCDGGGASHMA
jgi:hypothetical protein